MGGNLNAIYMCSFLLLLNMGRGRKADFYLCGFTEIILFYEKNLLGKNNLNWYNNELMSDIPWMQVEEKVFMNRKSKTNKDLRER